MIEKNPLDPLRVRVISGSSFAWIPHRFQRAGFWTTLSHHELLLYFFLILAADRVGLSYYGYDKIASVLGISVDDYIVARDGLIGKDLIAFDGLLFQVLSLPEQPVRTATRLLHREEDMVRHDPATISQLIKKSLSGCDA